MPDHSPEHTRASRPRRGNTTRWVAGLLLVPSVPLLLLSVAALGLFYVAPQRFGELLERLPGDQYLRSALAFAPAVLLAFVVLAILYALERPAPAEGEGETAAPATGGPAAVAVGAPAGPAAAVGAPAGPAEPAVGRPAVPAVVMAGAPAEAVAIPRPPRASPAFLASALALLLATPAFLASAVAALLAFIAPDPFWDLLSALPGQRYLRAGVPLAPLALLGFLVVAGMTAARTAAPEWAGRRKWLASAVPRLPTAISLAVAMLLWLGSLAGLLLFQLRPGLLDRLVDRLSTETLLRVQLAFAPVVLFAVVLLAGLSLIGGRPGQRGSTQVARSAAVVSLLSVGLVLTALLALALLAAVAVIIVG
jgi:hypothetical protein